MMLRTTHTEPRATDPRTWIGGEAALGSQAEHHVRQREGRTDGLFAIIMALTFIGGLSLGGALGLLRRDRAK